jgi:dTDP-4-amino-4,6-dideoxygalactose transaminase
MSVPDTVRHGAREVIFESYPEIGFNYRMTDVQAAIGRVQLTRLASIVDERRRIAAEYTKRLSVVNGVTAPLEPTWARSNWQSYCVALAEGCDQKGVMQHMLDAGVSTRRGVMNAHLERPYAPGTGQARLPRSESAQQRGVILPLAPSMTASQVQDICCALAAALDISRSTLAVTAKSI